MKQGKKICDPTGFLRGLPGSSAGKESTCSTGDPSSIPGLGRSPGEGIGYPLQYSWASMVAQMVKKSACSAGDLGSIPGLGRSLEKGKATHSSILAWRIPWGCKESDTTERLALESAVRPYFLNLPLSYRTVRRMSAHSGLPLSCK